MSKKSNFTIYFGNKPDGLIKPELSAHHEIRTGRHLVSVYYSKNCTAVKNKENNVFILLSGNIYYEEQISPEKYLLNKYLQYKKEFVKHLNGSFCLFFADKDSNEAFLATDRLNTRKIFKFEKGGKLIFSTDMNHLPLGECKLSDAGIASYLINGIMLNDLTAFDEIKKLERSSCYNVSISGIKSEQYWDYKFTNEYKDRSREELSEELNGLYLNSLKKILKGKKNIFISLSGGYDSRGIAAMLKGFSGNITCFSHNFGKDIKDTDSDIAKQISENLGYKFKYLNAYNGDPLEMLKVNAELGNGIASFCKEADSIEMVKKEFENSEDGILLTGDMYDGTYVDFHGNIKRALEKARICEPLFLKDFRSYLSNETYKILYKSWEYNYEKIYNKMSTHENMVNMLDYLYMDQLIPNLYSPAREYFNMPFIETAFPYYDIDILDFIQKVTPEMRDRKKLHKFTLEKYYPEIFKIKLSTKVWGNEPVWTDEISCFPELFLQNISSSRSQLDEIIPPETIIAAISELSNNDKRNKNKNALRTLHNTLLKFSPEYYKLIENLPGGKELTRKAGKYVNPRTSHPLVKILILRFFLIQQTV